jgi:hypothetical protein
MKVRERDIKPRSCDQRVCHPLETWHTYPWQATGYELINNMIEEACLKLRALMHSLPHSNQIEKPPSFLKCFEYLKFCLRLKEGEFRLSLRGVIYNSPSL